MRRIVLTGTQIEFARNLAPRKIYHGDGIVFEVCHDEPLPIRGDAHAGRHGLDVHAQPMRMPQRDRPAGFLPAAPLRVEGVHGIVHAAGHIEFLAARMPRDAAKRVGNRERLDLLRSFAGNIKNKNPLGGSSFVGVARGVIPKVVSAGENQHCLAVGARRR